MKLLMFGRGVINTIYGWALSQAGHEVTFFVRPGRSGDLGGTVTLDLIDVRRTVPPQEVAGEMPVVCSETLADLASFDLVVVSVRHDQMRAAAEQLAAAPRPKRGVLFFNNCWDDPGSITSIFQGSPVLWGFPVAGGEFVDAHHLAGAIMAQVHLAEADADHSVLHAQARALFESAGFKVEVHADFRDWLWLHFAVNAGMISQALIRGQSSSQLVSSVRELTQAARPAREAVRVAYARGVDPRAHRAESAIATMPSLLAGIIVKTLATRSAATRRLMTLHTNERELARFPLDVLAEAARLGVRCPLLRAAEAPARALIATATEG
jgi:2-dehydropantoate 2-reductase